MDTVTIADLHRRPGPHVSLYLPVVDADGVPVDRAAAELAEHLVSEGAPAELAEVAGEAATVAIADAGGLATFVHPGHDPIVVPLPEAPVATAVSVGSVPYLSPIVEWLQLSVPHAVVELGAAATDVTIFPRFEPSWSTHLRPLSLDTEAVVASQLASLLSRTELVVMAGPPAGLASCGTRLAAALPPTTRVVPVERDDRPAVEDLADETVRLENDHSARLTKERLDRFSFERAHDNVAEGVGATLDALRRRAATLLLVHDDVDDRRRAVRGPDPVDVGLDEADLAAAGPVPIVAGRLVDVAIGAALNSGVEVRMIPANLPNGPADGIGAALTP